MQRILTVAVAALVGCGGGGSSPSPKPQAIELGDPNPGLSAPQRDAFDRGKAIFAHRFTRSEGHGPHFNTNSCKSCHGIPVTGGSSPLYRNFELVAHTDGGGFDPAMEDDQFVARLFSYERTTREPIPADAEVVAQRNSPPTFGMGLLERIPVGDITINEDPTDIDGDKISGRRNTEDFVLGRFGYKAQAKDLVGFVRGPLFNHMGITTDPLGSAPTEFVAIAQASEPEEPNSDRRRRCPWTRRRVSASSASRRWAARVATSPTS
ncbi:MAG: hypothetical protein ACYTGZ_03760 [Planctomycetota bacterium]|jgi:CxxC motif-containing protein (DUF1111 family)